MPGSAASGRAALFTYANPVRAAILDAAPAFSRWHEADIACTAEEAGHAPGASERVVIWRAGPR
ncbi:MAG: hypothetical protein KGJ41_15850 [Rhodospirillales bacterium]|nr:hypothetical protein [Rhodospirillales bacterium]